MQYAHIHEPFLYMFTINRQGLSTLFQFFASQIAACESYCQLSRENYCITEQYVRSFLTLSSEQITDIFAEFSVQSVYQLRNAIDDKFHVN